MRAYLETIFSPTQMEEEHAIWTRALQGDDRAPFFEGMVPLLTEFRRRGGTVAVVSHSQGETIRRDYAAAQPDANPDLVYAWEEGEGRRKPHPWPALQAMEEAGVGPEATLALDDLSPGVQMAKAAGVRVVAAGWGGGHEVPAIAEYMRRECDGYCETVQQFAALLLEPTAAL